MKPEIEQLLQNASREDLLTLVQELLEQHPLLQAEIVSYFVPLAGNDLVLDEGAKATGDEGDGEEEIEEDWDFSGDEQEVFHTLPQPVQFPLDAMAHSQRLAEYAAQLGKVESVQDLMEVLSPLIDEAISYVGHGDANGALELFALMIDERLRDTRAALTTTYDEMIDAALYTVETLLSEASSNALFDAERVTLAPSLNPAERHRWLERLFMLWLKRLDLHRMEEDLPEMLLDVAWSEDMLLLRSMAQNELQQQPHSEHSNIVNFTRQYRTRALEKFLKELPRT